MSKSNQDTLNQIFKDYRFTDIINERIDIINNFFNSITIEYIEDVLVEHFDATGFDYEVSFGYYIPSYKYYSNSPGDSKKNILDKEYFESDDKNNYLFVSILEFLQKISDDFYKDNLKEIDDIKKRIEKKERTLKDWEKEYFRRNIDYFFAKVAKKVRLINPLINIKAKHKQKDEYYNLMYNVIWEPDEFNWTRKLDYNQIYELSKEIGKNARLSKLGLISSMIHLLPYTGVIKDFEIRLYFGV